MSLWIKTQVQGYDVSLSAQAPPEQPRNCVHFGPDSYSGPTNEPLPSEQYYILETCRGCCKSCQTHPTQHPSAQKRLRGRGVHVMPSGSAVRTTQVATAGGQQAAAGVTAGGI